MTIAAGDIKYAYTGSGSSSDPNASLGGAESDPIREITSASLEKLFDSVSPTEKDTNRTEYRAIDIHNNNTVDTMYLVEIEVIAQPSTTGVTFALAVDNTAGQNESIASEITAPVSAGTFATILSLSNIGPRKATGPRATASDGRIRIWVRRTWSAGINPATGAQAVLQVRATSLT